MSRWVLIVGSLILLTYGIFGGMTYIANGTADDEARDNAEAMRTDGGYTWRYVSDDGTIQTTTLDLDVHPTAPDVYRYSCLYESVPLYLIDPDDVYVRAVAEHVAECCPGHEVQGALSFVQTAIRYTSDMDLYGASDYWASPSECLYYHRGDCEDTSVLFASIAAALGHDVALIEMPGHVAALVQIDGRWAYCETATDTLLSISADAPDGDIFTYDSRDDLTRASLVFMSESRRMMSFVLGDLWRMFCDEVVWAGDTIAKDDTDSDRQGLHVMIWERKKEVRGGEHGQCQILKPKLIIQGLTEQRVLGAAFEAEAVVYRYQQRCYPPARREAECNQHAQYAEQVHARAGYRYDHNPSLQ